jgi:predicted nucleic acid-binding protein
LRFLDTSILLYSISRDHRETEKRRIAIDEIERGENAISVQVLQEFYVQATRPTRSDAVPHDIAVGLMSTWMRFPVQEITIALMANALDIKASARLSYWDAAIIAAAQMLGCRELLSEDMTHGRKIAGLTIINPFR